MSVADWSLAALGALLIGISKTGLPGAGVLAVAVFATIMPARESAGMVLPMLILADIVAIISYARDAEWKHLFRLFPWAVAGIIVGFYAVAHIDSQQTARLIGLILIVLIAYQGWRDLKRGGATPAIVTKPHSALLAPVMGLMAGFTTMVANAAGPIMNLYLLMMKMPKMQFMGTAAWYFFILNSFKVPFSWKLGLITKESLTMNLWLAPCVIVAAVAGRIMIRYINQRMFEVIALGFAFVAGVRLLLM